MSEKQIDFLKDKGISLANLVVLIGFIVYQAKFQQRTETTIEEFEEHKKDFKEFKTEVQQFYTPRSENKIEKENIYLILGEIKTDIKYLINRKSR